MPIGLPQRDAANLPPERSALRWLGLAAVSTLLASACCVLPLVLVLTGLAGAWLAQLAVLKPLVPVFTILAIGALGWAGYVVFSPPTHCGPDGLCATPPRWLRPLYVASAVVALALLSFPLFAPLFY
jgi:mercuric ion transport protein